MLQNFILSGFKLLDFTLKFPFTCSTTNLESRNISRFIKSFFKQYSSALSNAKYSASLLLAIPMVLDIV